VPGDHKLSGPPATTGEPPQQVPPPSSTSERLPHEGDPRRIGELLNSWLAIQMDKVDALVDEADTKVAHLPDLHHLWLLFGEMTVRLSALELEVAELRKGARR
jgi:hypothetical protein